MDFAGYGEKLLFCCAGNVGPSDLLDRIAFEALPLVVCTKGPMYKKVVDTDPSTSWG